MDAVGTTFRGNSWTLLHTQLREVVLSGPAGTGKSVASLAKLHYICEKVPNVRCLIVRKTRESLTESGLVTLEQKVMGPGHPVARGAQRRIRQSYTYPNGSVIVVGGMDKASKIMSTEYDLIYVQECIELHEPDWEALLTRLRNGRLPYQQILADTNPDTPTHWIKQRAAAGKLHLFDSRHEDNPRLYDADAPGGGRWTEEGRKYLALLDQLTGPRYQRLRRGLWVQAEGAVYDTFDRNIHVVDGRLLPPEWPRYLSIDFGYVNAFVCLWGAVDPDGRLWIYKQHVQTQKLVEDHAALIKMELGREAALQRARVTREHRAKAVELGQDGAGRWLLESLAALPQQLRPKAIICDHDAEDRATLERHLGLGTKAAHKLIRPGIQEVAGRLRVQGDGKPRLFITRDSVLARDGSMATKKLPIGIAEEMEGYVWDEAGGRKKGEEPVDKNNHCCDALRYLVAELDLVRSVKLEAWS